MKISDRELKIRKIEFVKRSATPIGTYSCGPRYSDCFVFVLSGGARYTFDGTEYNVGAKNVIYLAKDSRYAINVEDENYTYVYVDFYFDTEPFERMDNFLLSDVGASSLEQPFLKLYRNYINGTLCERIECMALLYEIYSSVISIRTSAYLPTEKKKTLAPAIELISKSFCDSSLTIRALSELAGVSEVHFRRIFSKLYGTSPKKYVTSLRIAKAREMLVGTKLKISEISELCGFENAYYFSKIMREQTGMTPSEIREKISLT